MGKDSKISWTDYTFNPWRGCTKISDGCAHCYADAQSARNPAVLGIWGQHGTRVVASESMWLQPLRWDRQAESRRFHERPRVFVASLADVFEDWTGRMRDSKGHPLQKTVTGRWIANTTAFGPADGAGVIMTDVRRRLFALIDRTPNLDWLLLTKRPENVLRMAFDCWCQRVPGHVQQNAGDGRRWKFPPNLWLGVSVEDQAAAEERIPHLLRVPAAVRFLSCEPLLGPVDLRQWLTSTRTNWRAAGGTYETAGIEPSIDWVIVGGESGPHARPMDPAWARSIRDQCRAANVPFFFKQAGGRGKDKGGDLLDGELIQEFPQAK